MWHSAAGLGVGLEHEAEARALTEPSRQLEHPDLTYSAKGVLKGSLTGKVCWPNKIDVGIVYV